MAGRTQQVSRTALNPQKNVIGPTIGGPNVPIRNLVWHGRRDDRYVTGPQTVPPVPRVLWSSQCILCSSQPLVNGNIIKVNRPHHASGACVQIHNLKMHNNRSRKSYSRPHNHKLSSTKIVRYLLTFLLVVCN